MENEEFEEIMMEETTEDAMYTKSRIREAVEDDDLNPIDAAFMEGYLAG